jgi:hypothetical protein
MRLPQPLVSAVLNPGFPGLLAEVIQAGLLSLGMIDTCPDDF